MTAPATPSSAGSPNAAGEVIQADREAAFKLLVGEKVGGGDGATYVAHQPSPEEAARAFARHRLAHTNEAASQPVEREALCLLIEQHCPDKPDDNNGLPIGSQVEALADRILALTASQPRCEQGAVERLREALHKITTLRPIGATASQHTCALMEHVATDALRRGALTQQGAGTRPEAGEDSRG